MLENQIQTFKKRLLQLPQVESATVSNYLPIAGSKRNGNGFWKEGRTQEDPPVFAQRWQVDADYVEDHGHENLARQRFFS